MKQISENMNNNSNLCNQFYRFLEENNNELEDFYLSQTAEQKLVSLVGKENAKNFEVILVHSSHSVICFFTAHPSKPIVWLDSEGELNSVFAQNVEEFLSLIPYGSGCYL